MKKHTRSRSDENKDISGIRKENEIEKLNIAAVLPKKSLGQNFLKDAGVSYRILEAARSQSFLTEFQNRCLEIGPGTGALTQILYDANFQICAVELDPRCVDFLNTQNYDQDRFRLAQIDILECTEDVISDLFQFFGPSAKPVCLGNIPYYITSDILLWFSKFSHFFTHGVFMVQKEVAQRLVAPPGSKSYGRLSIKLQLQFEVTLIEVVPAKLFHPAPKVDSAVICLVPLEKNEVLPDEILLFERFTSVLFSQRRKMLRGTLKSMLNLDELKEQFWQEANTLGVSPELRPENLSPTTMLLFFRLVRSLNKNLSF